MQTATTTRSSGLGRSIAAAIGGVLVLVGFSTRWLSSGNGSQQSGFGLLGIVRDGDVPSSRWLWTIVALALVGATVSVWAALWSNAAARTVSAAGALTVLVIPVFGVVAGALPLGNWAIGLWLVAVGGIVLLIGSGLPGGAAFKSRDADTVRHPMEWSQ